MTPESNTDYQRQSYEELSKGFKDLYPKVVRVFQLIPQMYDRLTLVDIMSHRAAITKTYKDLHGLDPRKIHRYLPNISHRVVTPPSKSK